MSYAIKVTFTGNFSWKFACISIILEIHVNKNFTWKIKFQLRNFSKNTEFFKTSSFCTKNNRDRDESVIRIFTFIQHVIYRSLNKHDFLKICLKYLYMSFWSQDGHKKHQIFFADIAPTKLLGWRFFRFCQNIYHDLSCR